MLNPKTLEAKQSNWIAILSVNYAKIVKVPDLIGWSYLHATLNKNKPPRITIIVYTQWFILI